MAITNCFLPSKKFLQNCKIFPQNPHLFNLLISCTVGTLSNAFERSRNMLSTVFPLMSSSNILCWLLKMLLIVLLLLLNPCCASENRLNFSACSCMCFCKSFSRILTNNSVSATGLYEAGSPGSLPGLSKGEIKLRVLMLGSSSLSRTVLHHLQIIGPMVFSVFFRSKGLIPDGPELVLVIFLIIFLDILNSEFYV